jgi:hypothetical protein
MSKRNFKRLVFIADSHCGTLEGLVNPDYALHHIDNPTTEKQRKRNKVATIEAEVWNWYYNTIKKLQPINTLVHLGDCIDGLGKKTAGREQITTDLNEQVEIASECIKLCNADKNYILYGSNYHVGGEIDYEDLVAQKVKAEIKSHLWLEYKSNINDKSLIFDCKHKIGGATSPFSRGAAISKDQLWNAIWAEKNLQPKSNCIIRGHVHYDYFVGNSDFLGVICPSLCWGSVYGERQCSGLVSIGLTVFDIYPDATYDWHFEMAKLDSQKAHAIQMKM